MKNWSCSCSKSTFVFAGTVEYCESAPPSKLGSTQLTRIAAAREDSGGRDAAGSGADDEGAACAGGGEVRATHDSATHALTRNFGPIHTLRRRSL